MAKTLREMWTTKILCPRVGKQPKATSELPVLLRTDRLLAIQMEASRVKQVRENVANEEVV